MTVTGHSDARGEQEPPLPLRELDRSLAPLRRVLAWAVVDRARAASLAYLETNGGRSLAAALSLDLPTSLREALEDVGTLLVGFDEQEPEARQERVQAMHQEIGRVDAVLGLPLPPEPLPVRMRPRPQVEEERAAPEQEEDSRRERRRGRKKGRRRKEEAPAPQPTAEAPVERRYRLGDPAHTGRSLEDLGIEPDLAARLASAGIETGADLLQLPPEGEEVVRPVHGAGREVEAGRAAIGGRVRRRLTRCFPDGGVRGELLLVGAGPVEVWFDGRVPGWLLEGLPLGERAILVGRYEPVDGEGQDRLHHPEPGVDDGHHAVRLPTYGLEEATDREVRLALHRVLPLADQLQEPLPPELLASLGVPSLGAALRGLHSTGAARPENRRRLAFEELLVVELGQALPRYQAGRERGIRHTLLHGMAARLARMLEVELDDAQQLALDDVQRDLRRTVPMQRVLTGEVAGGKGLVALLAMVMVAEGRNQILYLAQDGISAETRFLFTEPWLREMGLVGRLIVGEPSRGQRDAIRRGEVHVVFGSDSLLDAQLDFRRLGLVIIEEREPYGRLASRVESLGPPRPDRLVIPWMPASGPVLTSAYAGWDVSRLDPSERAPVRSSLHEAKDREEVYRGVAEQVRAGRQAFLVFPTARGVDALDAREAQRVIVALQSGLFQGARLALYHGALAREERHRLYEDFRHRRIDVLVGTTLFENGPEVPGATVAIIEQADRANPHRVHRIRRYLARSGVASELHCIVGDVPDGEGLEQLKRVLACDDGFAILEEALEERGRSAMLYEGAAEAPDYRYADPRADLDLLLSARNAARALLDEDPSLRRIADGELARLVRERWSDLLSGDCPIPEAPSGGGRRRRRRRRKE